MKPVLRLPPKQLTLAAVTPKPVVRKLDTIHDFLNDRRKALDPILFKALLQETVLVASEQLVNFEPDPTAITAPGAVAGEKGWDGVEALEQLKSGTQPITVFSRAELIAIARLLGATEDDTKGKTVKQMQERVSTLMTTTKEVIEKAKTVMRPTLKLARKSG